MNDARPWERWDEPGIARAIDAKWRGDPSEIAHRQRLAELTEGAVAMAAQRGAKGGSFLEVGCGSGCMAEHLRLRMPALNYTGADRSRKMLEIARERYPLETFIEADVFALPMADLSYDVVAAYEVLGHLPEIEKPIYEMLRVAMKLVLFTLWSAESERDEGESVDGVGFIKRTYSDRFVERVIAAAAQSLGCPFYCGWQDAGLVRMYSVWKTGPVVPKVSP